MGNPINLLKKDQVLHSKVTKNKVNNGFMEIKKDHDKKIKDGYSIKNACNGCCATVCSGTCAGTSNTVCCSCSGSTCDTCSSAYPVCCSTYCCQSGTVCAGSGLCRVSTKCVHAEDDLSDIIEMNRNQTIIDSHYTKDSSIGLKFTIDDGSDIIVSPLHYLFTGNCKDSDTKQSKDFTLDDKLCINRERVEKSAVIVSIERVNVNNWFNLKTIDSWFSYKGFKVSHHTGYHLSGLINKAYNKLVY
jgi:hypothetical protein